MSASRVLLGIASAGVGLALVSWLLSRRRKLEVRDSEVRDSEVERVHETSRGNAHVIPAPRHPIRIFFGSQTGTSESFAREIAEEAVTELGLVCEGAESLETLDLEAEFGERVNERVNAIFILSTYGEGDASDDAIEFENQLKAEVDLKNLNYAIFGLGSKQYAYFNEMAKRTDKRLRVLGARRVTPVGFGDDNGDIEADFEAWKKEVLWPNFVPACFSTDYESLKKKNIQIRNPLDKVQLDLRLAPKRSQLPFDASVTSGGSEVASKFLFASNLVPVKAVIPLSAGKVQIDLDIAKVPSLRYRTGDTLEVLPLNREEDVAWLLELFGLSGDLFASFSKKKSVKKLTVKKPFPTPCLLGQAVARYVDLASAPTRMFIRDMCLCTKREELIDELTKRNVRGDSIMTVRSLLTDLFPDITSHMDFSTLLQLLPKQKARAYSICSSSLVDPKRISLLVSKVDEFALASSFLVDRTKVNDTLLVHLRSGVFRLPALPQQPIVMICVGTGFAPFRAFLAELKPDRDAILFFGCRSRAEWIYREEMETTILHVAFSREGSEKVYVQNLLMGQAEVVKSLVGRNAVVYVCGSTQMGLAVMDVFNRHIADVDELRTHKRYVEELWG